VYTSYVTGNVCPCTSEYGGLKASAARYGVEFCPTDLFQVLVGLDQCGKTVFTDYSAARDLLSFSCNEGNFLHAFSNAQFQVISDMQGVASLHFNLYWTMYLALGVEGQLGDEPEASVPITGLDRVLLQTPGSPFGPLACTVNQPQRPT
jgi:hypothetical protein